MVQIMENNKKTPLIIDRPRERNRLVLGFTNYIDAICNFIMDSVPHFTVGIFGEWGAGKTTLLKNIQTDLEKHYGCACVMFDAWEYEDETTQMAIPLILTIITAIYKNNKGEIEKLEDEQNDENQDI